MDENNATARRTAATFSSNRGVPVRLGHRSAIVHRELIAVNGHIVETGSYYRVAGEKSNAEEGDCPSRLCVAEMHGQERGRFRWNSGAENARH